MSAGDTVTLGVTHDSMGIGVPVNTLDTSGGPAVVRVGTSTYATPDRSRPLQLVVLDRGTLELRSNEAYPGTAEGASLLRGRLGSLGIGDVAIVATPAMGTVAPMPDGAALKTLNNALTHIGAPALPASVASSTTRCGTDGGVCGGFSAIGSGTFEVGQGAVNPGLGTLGRVPGSADGGSLQGYLQRDVSGDLHTFVPSDHVSFDTTGQGTTARRAAIEVDGKVHLSEPLPDPKNGAYVLVLDAGTLAPRDEGTFSLRYDSVDAIVGEESRMTRLLNTYAGDSSALVFVQTIGDLARWDAYEDRGDIPYWWTQLAIALERLGSHRALFNSITDHAYAQVGPGAVAGSTYPASPWTAVSTPPGTGSAGQLAGTLSRNSSSQFYPSNASARDEPGDAVTVLAYQPPQPWPQRQSPQQRAALSCVASSLDLSLPIEDSYDNLNLRGVWDTNAAWLDRRDRDQLRCDVSGFDDDTWAAVRDQLYTEFKGVPVVHDLVDDIAAPLTGTGTGAAEIERIASQIADQVDDRKSRDDNEATMHALDLTEDVFLLLGSLPEVGEGADLIASLIGLTNDAVLDDGKPQTTTTDELQIQADELAGRLADAARLQADDLAVVREILVGDPGKLATAAANASDAWKITAVDQAQSVALLQRATRRTTYRTLFPTSYGGLVRLTRGTTSFPDATEASGYRCWFDQERRARQEFEPFGGVPAHGAQNVYPEAGPLTEHWVYVKEATVDNWLRPAPVSVTPDFSPVMPTQALLDAMFGTDGDAPGLAPLEFALGVAPELTQATISRHSTVFGTSDDVHPNQCQSG